MRKNNGDEVNTTRSELTLYVYNMAEDVWPFIMAMGTEKARAEELEIITSLADRELLSLADLSSFVFVGPKPIEPAFVEYYRKLCDVRQVTTLYPKQNSGRTSIDIINDPELFAELVTMGKSASRLKIISYSTSPEFLELVAALRQAGVEVYTPESPEANDAWTVNFFGSKSGIRQLAQWNLAKEPDLMMADGVICVGADDAAKIAANKYLKEKGVVIKTNKGHTGMGVLIFREGDLPTEYDACQKAIVAIFKKNKYWESFPIVIESLINVNFAVGGGFPNVEFKIRKSGEVELLYYCGLRVTKAGEFEGVEINEDAISDRITARIVDTGFHIGEQLAAAGYRGFYDVDFVAAKNGQIYVTEANIRRTGGTYAYSAVLELIGKNFMTEAYTVSRSNFMLPGNKPASFEKVTELLQPVLYNKKTKEGVIVASANLLKQATVIYIVTSPNQKRTLAIEAKMHELLETLQ